MTLNELLNDGKLKPHRTSAREISDLLKVAERDLADAGVSGLSTDRRFAIAYSAILQLATILLYARGYQTTGTGHHFITFQAIKEILPKEYAGLIDYFDACRSKRNISDYDHPGGVSAKETDEIIAEAKEFKKVVMEWLRDNCPKLVSPDTAR